MKNILIGLMLFTSISSFAFEIEDNMSDIIKVRISKALNSPYVLVLLDKVEHDKVSKFIGEKDLPYRLVLKPRNILEKLKKNNEPKVFELTQSEYESLYPLFSRCREDRSCIIDFSYTISDTDEKSIEKISFGNL